MDASHLLYSPAAKHWKEIGITPRHGIVVPLFSIHSAQSNGIGEFLDLIPLIDWCHSVGLTIIQLLPLNDTGTGSSPYSALSAFALNPIYLSLSSLPFINQYTHLKDELNALPKFSGQLRIEYEHVRNNKEGFLTHYFEKTAKRLLRSKAYQAFYQSAPWLESYALFRTLKKRYQWVQWEIWPEEAQIATLDLKNTLSPEEQIEMQNHCLTQFLCSQQLSAAKKYADKHQILLMGDMPILVDRDSADVWFYRSFFDLNYSAGAPPDYFSEEGQSWGFPIYKWDVLAETNYQWWIERLQWWSRYFHLYRIDHIVGFFRIWSIPIGLKEKDGFFIPTDENLWIDHGQRLLLMMLNACSMLPVGEDLGVIPTKVRECMRALGICGTRVMRWEKEWDAPNQPFITPDNYLIESMTTVSTHDSETLQQWWQNCPKEAQFFCYCKGWDYHPVLSRDHHLSILWESHHTQSIFHINPLQEYLTLVPGLSWPNIEDERINTPGLFSEKNWSYRMRISLEELLQQQTLAHLVKEIIQ